MIPGIDLRLTFLILLIHGLETLAISQRVVINSSGDRVIMYPDGTWRAPEAADSILLRQYSAAQEGGPKSTGSQNRNKGEEYEFLQKQWNGLFIDLQAEEKEVQANFRNATNAQFKAAEQLRNAEANKKLVEPDLLASLHEEYELSVNNLRNAKLQQKEIKSLVEKGQKINNKPQSITQSKINRVRTSFTIYLSRFQHTPVPIIQPATTSSTPFQPKPEVVPKPPAAKPASKEDSTAPYDPKMIGKRPPGAEPGVYTAEPYACLFDTDTIDQSTGSNRRELHPEVLFTYTDPDLRPFFKSKDLITCRARLSKIGPYTYLSVEFQIASSHSQSNFGILAEGSLLRFELMNDEYVSLYNLKLHSGRIDPYSGYTIFAGQYALGKSELKKLRSAELDKMRVLWSTGYEDYDIYRLDLLKDQINCLEAKD